MPICNFCSTSTTTYILPPDMIGEQITDGEHRGKRMCHFCQYGQDHLIGSDGSVYKKDDVCADYKQFCDGVYHKPEIYVLANKSLIDGSVAKK